MRSLVAAVLLLVAATPAHAAFGVSLYAPRSSTNADDARETQAGAHPLRRASPSSRSTPPRHSRRQRQGHPRRPAARADLQPAGDAELQRRGLPVSCPREHADRHRAADGGAAARPGHRDAAGLQHGDRPRAGRRTSRSRCRSSRRDRHRRRRSRQRATTACSSRSATSRRSRAMVSSTLTFWGVPSRSTAARAAQPFLSLPTAVRRRTRRRR